MNISPVTSARWALMLVVAAHFISAAPTGYLTSSTTPDGAALLPMPPSAGSLEDQADDDEAFHIYSTRTPDQVALGTDENKLTIFHFAPAIGAGWKPGKFPKTEALFARVEAELGPATDNVKEHFKRVRPCNAHPDQFSQPIEHPKLTSYSYPSGHSTRGTVYAIILSELFPEKHDALLAKGREAGWLRVQGGVHYPLDIYAGRVWGQAMAHALLASPDFQRDLADAKAEVAAAKL